MNRSTLKIIRVPLLILILITAFFIEETDAQVVNWEFLQEGQEVGTCTAGTDFEAGVVCYGLEYTPSVTGTLTSYTMAFYVECLIDYSPPISAASCTFTDNTQIFEDCANEGIIFIQVSGQLPSTVGDGSGIAVVQDVPVIIHQVCLDFHFLDTIDVSLDDITGISMSIDGPDGPITDQPPFGDIELDYTGFDLRPCSNDVVCETRFSKEEERVSFDTLADGNIIIGDASLTESTSTQSFDVFDEINKFCGIPGGEDDISIEFTAINTYDVYGDGALNTFVGAEMFVKQDIDGVSSVIPFGSSPNSASSSGDVRGYEMKVLFADHLRIEANQVNVLLRYVNGENSVFESASVEFLGPEGLPFGKATYEGYYENGADLSGTCSIATAGTPYSSTGNGVVTIADPSRIDLTDPCNPVQGAIGTDTVIVNAVTDGNLHPSDIIGGFVVTILGEDIATPSLLDDGSNMNGEDHIPGNRATTTNTQVNTSILGFGVDGCVFLDPFRKKLEITYDSSPEFVSIGDTIRYNVNVYNRTTLPMDSIDLTMDLPEEIVNLTGSAGLLIDMNTVSYDSLPLARLDSAYLYIKGVLTPSAVSDDEIIDIIDGGSSFKDSSDHHTFTGWSITTAQPRSGVEHWEVVSDSATSVKYLYLDKAIIPTDSTEFSFYHNYDTELHKDGGRVEISVDNGSTWDALDTVFYQNGYNDYINSDISFAGFSGTQLGYIESIASLESFKDESALIRFVFYSDCEGKNAGWRIDDITLTNLKNALHSEAYAEIDTLNDSDNIFPVTQVVACTDVYSTADSGVGTLRRSIACADAIDQIVFMPSVHDQVIQLNSAIDITKEITINAKNKNVVISQISNDEIFVIANQSALTLKDITLTHSGQTTSNTITNNNILNLTNTTINGKMGSIGLHIQNFSTLNLDGTNLLIKEQ